MLLRRTIRLFCCHVVMDEGLPAAVESDEYGDPSLWVARGLAPEDSWSRSESFITGEEPEKRIGGE